MDAMSNVLCHLVLNMNNLKGVPTAKVLLQAVPQPKDLILVKPSPAEEPKKYTVQKVAHHAAALDPAYDSKRDPESYLIVEVS